MISLGLVVAQYYDSISKAMKERALDKIEHQNAEIASTVAVRGVYDSPLAADRLARRDAIDAVAVLGAVITGDADHDEVVAHVAARKLSDVSLQRDTPVTLGIIGPSMSSAEARDRIEYGSVAVPIAVKTALELP
ncbi:MAG: 6,7-dimethyl-8-ribityllumazine synthase [Halobacteriaceae archaeon]